MQELVKEYREWRKEQDLPWNPNLVPKEFDGLPDLEHKYWQAEQKALAFEKQRDAKAKEVTKALPPTRPRKARPLIRKGDKPGQIFMRKQGSFGGDELKVVLNYVDEGLKKIGETLLDIRAKDLESIQSALDKRLLWRGTWRAGESYVSNDLVQDKGTIFVCNAAKSEERPGSGAGWRMLVKTQERAAK